MARPTKDDAAKRTERFNLRLTPAELAHVQQQAAHAGIGAHDYARRRVLGHRVPPARSQIDATLLTELNRIGVNLNQLAMLPQELHERQEFGFSACIMSVKNSV